MIGRILRIALAAIGVLIISASALYLYSPPKSLDVLNDVVPGDAGVERVAAAARFMSGPDGKLDVWMRPAAAAKRRPVMIFFYGGAWVKGRRIDYGFVGKAYAARGFVVAIPDYRNWWIANVNGLLERAVPGSNSCFERRRFAKRIRI